MLPASHGRSMSLITRPIPHRCTARCTIPMSGMRSSDGARGAEPAAGQDETRAAATPHEAASGTLRILVVDADAALFGLLEEWLGACECVLAPAESRAGGVERSRYDVVIVDVPFPRQGGAEVLRRVAREVPGTPIIALSSSFFAGIEQSGAVARSLGVDAVLPKPLKPEALHDAVDRIVRLRR